MQIDFGRTAEDYARHRAGFPDALFDRLMQDGVTRPGEHLLDLGTGTGSMARGFARRGLDVTGLDPSEPLLAQAERLDREAGVTVRYVVARAEDTGLRPASFEIVTAGQCWHWFDRPAVAREAHRVLTAGGRLVLAHFDWLPLPGNVVEATERLILEHNPKWRGAGGVGIHPKHLTDLTLAGFEQLATFSFDQPVIYSHAAWRGRIRASAGVAASLSPDQVARFDADLAALLTGQFPDDPSSIPHRCWAAIGYVSPSQ